MAATASTHQAVEPMDTGSLEDPPSPGPPPLEDQNGMEVTAPVQKSAKAIQQEIHSRLTRHEERRKVNLTALNPYIVCSLCKGYLIDPVTVVECLHSFCKSCIVKHVGKNRHCPSCDTLIHKTKPLLSLRADTALQDIVYRIVPGLYSTEMKNRVQFYTNHPEGEPTSLEDAGETSERLFFSTEDLISMSIEYYEGNSSSKQSDDGGKTGEPGCGEDNPNRRFLQCPGSVTVQLLKKFITTKYDLDANFLVDVIYKDDLLPEDQTLVDVAYFYNWRKTSPMKFYYRIYQKTKILTRKRKKKRSRTGGQGRSQQPASKKHKSLHSAGYHTWTDAASQKKEEKKREDVEANGTTGKTVLTAGRSVSNKSPSNSSAPQLSPAGKDRSSATKSSLSPKSISSSLPPVSAADAKSRSTLYKASPTKPTGVVGEKRGSELSAEPKVFKLPHSVSAASSDPTKSATSPSGGRRSADNEPPAKKANKTVSNGSSAGAEKSVIPSSKPAAISSTVEQQKLGTASSALTTTAASILSKSTSASTTGSSRIVTTPTTSLSTKSVTSATETVTSGVKFKIGEAIKNGSKSGTPAATEKVKNSSSSASNDSGSLAASKKSDTSNSLPPVKLTITCRPTLETGSKQNPVKTVAQQKPATETPNSAVSKGAPTSQETKVPAPAKLARPEADRKLPQSNKLRLPETKSGQTTGDKAREQKSNGESDKRPKMSTIIDKLSSPNRMVNSDKKKVENSDNRKEVVEISVEVSASDVKKVLEKKRAEKDKLFMSTTAGEEKLYSNYSIVDQIKKAGTAANLARQHQTERASMMDFARPSEALTNSGPKVPPNVQGLQPKNNNSSSGADSGLSAIVQSLAQRQLQLTGGTVGKETSATTTKSSGTASLSTTKSTTTTSSPFSSLALSSSSVSADSGAKTIGTVTASALSVTKTSDAGGKAESGSNPAAASTVSLKLPGTSINPVMVNKDEPSPAKTGVTVDTNGALGQQVLNFYKSNISSSRAAGGSLSDAAKSAESLTRNIPAGTTVTVKTVENKAAGSKPAGPAASTSVATSVQSSLSSTSGKSSSTATPSMSLSPASSKGSTLRMSLSNSNFPTTASVTPLTLANPYTSMASVTQASFVNHFVQSTLRDQVSMALAAQQAQYLNLSNQPFSAAAALVAHIEAANYVNTAANMVRAAQAAQQAQSTMATLEFSKHQQKLDDSNTSQANNNMLGIKIPQPQARSSPTLGSFGTSRLQVKVNSDSPREGSPKAGNKPGSPVITGAAAADSPSAPLSSIANGKFGGTHHSMPAILPFHGAKKVQALPKTSSSSRPLSGTGGLLKSGLANGKPSSPPIGSMSLTMIGNKGVPAFSAPSELKPKSPAVSAPSGVKPDDHEGSPAKLTGGAITPPSTPVTSSFGSPLLKPITTPQVNTSSLKKLAADLNTAQQKALLGDNNLFNVVKKSNEKSKLLDFKNFGKESNPMKEVTSS